jgi:hypothetical protein
MMREGEGVNHGDKRMMKGCAILFSLVAIDISAMDGKRGDWGVTSRRKKSDGNLISGSPRDRSRGGMHPIPSRHGLQESTKTVGVGKVVGGRNYRGLTFRLHSLENTCAVSSSPQSAEKESER